MEDIEPTLESLHESAAYLALTENEVNCKDTVNKGGTADFSVPLVGRE